MTKSKAPITDVTNDVKSGPGTEPPRRAAYLPSIHHYTARSISGSHRAPGALTPHLTTAARYPNIFLASSGFWMQISILCRYLNLDIYLHFTLPWIKSVNITADRILDTASPAISHQVSHLQTFVTIERGEARSSHAYWLHTPSPDTPLCH